MPEQIIEVKMPDRTTGVEIETFSKMTPHDTAVFLGERLAGICGVNLDRHDYHATDGRQVIVKVDGSLGSRNAAPTGYNHGVEIVTPALSATKTIELVRAICEAIKDIAKINLDCGLHVHVGARDMKWNEVVKVANIYTKFERIIDNFFPESRRNSKWAAALGEHNQHNGRQSYAEVLHLGRRQVERALALREHSSRYYKVNLHRFITDGIIEFRQHNGTIEAEKICNWVAFLAHLVEYGRKVTVMQVKDLGEARKFYNQLGYKIKIREMRGYGETHVPNAFGKAAFEFFSKRYGKFSPSRVEALLDRGLVQLTTLAAQAERRTAAGVTA